ncbi:MAG: endonuclease [Chlorobiaceae bacterium]|nr:endonuclease [Chlorobiaceae bacterium]
MKYYVYLLFSKEFNRTYVGQTQNLENRLDYHNSGKVRSTKHHRPWIILYDEEFRSRSEAMKREKWFKSSVGRKFIRELLSKLSVESLQDDN